MIDSALLKAMAKAGVTAEQIAVIADEYDALTAEKRAEKREQGRIRQQNHRARNAMSRVTERYERDTPSSLEVSPQTPLPKTSNPIPPSPPKGGSSPAEFAEFWELFPNKVGKREAERAFVKARLRAPFEAIIAGLRRYVAKTDDRPWCNPATFLNQDRWADQPADPAPRQQAPPHKRNFADVAMDKFSGQANGTESIFGSDGDAQRVPSRGCEPGPDDGHLRGGIGLRIVPGGY